jgi:hypothetical protein
LRWAHAAGISVAHQADEMLHEINFMHARRHRFKADPFPGKSPADDPQRSAPADTATDGDPVGGPMSGILELTDRRTKKPAALTVKRSGFALVQRFVRPVIVIVMDPAGGTPLLSARVGSRRTGYLGLVNTMHLFMGSVVLRLTAPSKLHLNSQTQPPGRQPRQIQRALTGEGRAMIDADDPGFSITQKKPLKIPTYRFVLIAEQTNAQDKTAEQIAHGQRIDPLPISRAEPAFEINRPNVVGLRGIVKAVRGTLGPRRARIRRRRANPSRFKYSVTVRPLGR